jgi:cytochrome c peroxidase
MVYAGSEWQLYVLHTVHNGQTAFASNTKCATCHVGVKGLERLKKKSQAVEKK